MKISIPAVSVEADRIVLVINKERSLLPGDRDRELGTMHSTHVKVHIAISSGKIIQPHGLSDGEKHWFLGDEKGRAKLCLQDGDAVIKEIEVTDTRELSSIFPDCEPGSGWLVFRVISGYVSGWGEIDLVPFFFPSRVTRGATPV